MHLMSVFVQQIDWNRLLQMINETQAEDEDFIRLCHLGKISIPENIDSIFFKAPIKQQI